MGSSRLYSIMFCQLLWHNSWNPPDSIPSILACTKESQEYLRQMLAILEMNGVIRQTLHNDTYRHYIMTMPYILDWQYIMTKPSTGPSLLVLHSHTDRSNLGYACVYARKLHHWEAWSIMGEAWYAKNVCTVKKSMITNDNSITKEWCLDREVSL